jgi:hypothetical protein
MIQFVFFLWDIDRSDIVNSDCQCAMAARAIYPSQMAETDRLYSTLQQMFCTQKSNNDELGMIWKEVHDEVQNIK